MFLFPHLLICPATTSVGARNKVISSHFDIGLGFHYVHPLRQASNSISGRLPDSISELNWCILFGNLKCGNTRGSHVGPQTYVFGSHVGTVVMVTTYDRERDLAYYL